MVWIRGFWDAARRSNCCASQLQLAPSSCNFARCFARSCPGSLILIDTCSTTCFNAITTQFATASASITT
jgi:hypothetical protein